MKEFFKPPTAVELALRELEEAKRELLRAMSGQDYIKRIVEYNEDRVKRLTEYLEKNNA